MEIFRMFGSIMIKDQQAQNSLSNMDNKVGGLGSKFKSVGMAVGKFGLAAGAAAAAAGTAVFGMAKKAADATDRIDKMSSKLGLSKQAFQEWDFIMSQNGVSMEKMGVGLRTLASQAVNAENGSERAAEAFRYLGVTTKNTNGEFKDREQLLKETITALQGVEDNTKRTAIAADLFGMAGRELSPILDSNAESIDGLRKKAHDLGLVLSDDAVAAGVKFTDQLDQVKRSFDAIVAKIGIDFMPIMADLMNWITKNMPIIRKIFGTVFKAIGVFVKTASNIFNKFILPVLKTFLAVVLTVQKRVKNWVNDNSDLLNELFNSFKKVFSSIQKVVMIILNAIQKFWNKHGDKIIKIVSEAFKIIIKVFTFAFDKISEYYNTFAKLLQGNWKGFFKGLFDIAKSIGNKILGVFDKLFSSIAKGVVGLFKKTDDIQNGLTESTEVATEKIGGFISNVDDIISGFLSDFKTEESIDYGGAIAEGIESGLSKLPDTVEEVGEEVKEEVKDNTEDIKAILVKRYEEEERLQEESMNYQLKELRNVTNSKIKEYEREYNSRIALVDKKESEEINLIQQKINEIDNLTKQENKAKREAEYNDLQASRKADIEKLKQQLQTGELSAKEFVNTEKEIQKIKDDILKDELEKEREALLEKRELQKKELREDIDNIRKKATLLRDKAKKELDAKTKIENDLLNIKINYQEKELERIKEHYEILKEEENISAEARKLVAINNNNEMVSLLNSFNPEFKNVGKTLGESISDGINASKQSIMNTINDIKSIINQANLDIQKSLAQQNIMVNTQKSDMKNNFIGGMSGQNNTSNTNNYNKNINLYINNPKFFNDKDVDRMGAALVKRLRTVGAQ